ncbi:exodeoxyribonuclease I [Thiolapillus brandeum]|uniref:Exodeoxyribonuclease I n=1 Tax=Thiolapillus brandeum TaxID=1076588 RepID=A0A7U6JIE2_9GAMM|nr:exodeoxyribonuclease I [Thiolapillus brandeum]BAO44767.1 exodeoxyribonuclease I [Thiolapillus brandeum]
MTRSFYWHDYETWGTDPRRDRAVQFAGLRTDLDFNPIGRPLMVYASPADDMLPQPGACLVTGITPQLARAEGVCEADFFKAINDELSRPGTCALGYNSIRFDDEFTRYGLYRNFYDPYAREWQNGNSRWDIIDVVRLAHALRPEGIEWPLDENGVTSFRLEKLTAANGIEHEGAHDALVDVRATIAMARLIKEKQPRLFDYVFNNRDKRKLGQQLNIRDKRPVVHVSAKYPARLGCIAVVVPLAMHPANKNGVIVYDLRVDPRPLFELNAEQIREKLYTRTEDLEPDEVRIPLKMISLNHSPVVVPVNTLGGEAREKWDLDPQREQRHLQQILAEPDLEDKIRQVYREQPFSPVSDPDQALYGSFISNHDRRICEQVLRQDPGQLRDFHPVFEDRKLAELLFRYRARNWPDSLEAEERQRWEEYRLRRLTDYEGGGSIVLQDYRRELSRLVVDPELTSRQREVVNALLDWPDEIGVQ